MNIKETLGEFMAWAKQNNWELTEKSDPHLHLSSSITSRFKELPNEYVEFLSTVAKCVTSNEATWFICEDDFNNNSDTAFKWNEFEWLSLEAAAGDANWQSEITAWWDKYLPIVMSVEGGYSFYAIDLTRDRGAIVRGAEPEFEEVDKVANTFEQFLVMIMSNSIEI